MAQGDYLIQNQSFPSFRSDLNETLEAINTSNSGTSRPTSAVAGTVWLDTTNATNPTLKFFDGTDDISLAQLDYSANTVNWLDSTVTISPLTTDLDVGGNAIISSSNGNITFTPDGTGKVIISGLSYPSSDGTSGQFLKTDGAGNLSFDTVTTAGTTLTTQGDILYRDGSGLARLGAGTSGQVLQTNGTGANPSWGTVSSDMVKVADVNGGGTSALAIDSCFSSTYDNYIVFANIHTSTTALVNIRFQNSSNTEVADSTYYYAGTQTNVNSSSSGGGTETGWGQDKLSTNESIASETDGYGQYIIHISKPFVSGKQSYMQYDFHSFDGGDIRTCKMAGGYRDGTSMAGFRFFASTGDITSNSNVKVYGLK